MNGCLRWIPLPLQGDSEDPSLPNYIDGPPPSSRRGRAMPFAFRCGRMVVLMLDSRGERDVFRDVHPVLGSEQWEFIDHVFQNLAADVEALAVVTPTPLASLSPEGQTQKLVGRRTDDVDLFRKGDLEGLLNLGSEEGELRLTDRHFNLGSFFLSNIDEARDQWSHRFSRPEQIDLIRKAGAARLTNRTSGNPRGLIFLSGDIHVGGTFDISVSNPRFQATSLVSSGISNIHDDGLLLGVFVDEDFEVAPGIHSTLRELVNTFNFGVVDVVPTGAGAKIFGSVAHEGNSFVYGLDLAALL